MPSFWAINPVRIAAVLVVLQLDLDVDAGGEVELHQCVHGLRGRVDDVQQPLVRADLELLAALLVDVRRPVHGETLDPGRQRDGKNVSVDDFEKLASRVHGESLRYFFARWVEGTGVPEFSS